MLPQDNDQTKRDFKAMAEYDGKTDDILNEKLARKLNWDLLTNGYIRSELNKEQETTPPTIIELCIKYAEIADILPTDNPVNFISADDIQKCEYYKSKGNEYYKLKKYQQAINKYTTATRFNPNNHFVLNNRALCHFAMKNYTDSASDAQCAIQADPTFYKAWHRYGTTLEKLGNFRFAGICYKTAYMLTVNWNPNNTDDQKTDKQKNQYKIHYDKYMKKLKKSGQKNIIKWIDEFEETAGKTTPEERVMSILTKQNDEETLKEMMQSGNGQKILMDLFQNDEYLDIQKEEELYGLMSQSKYKYLMQNGLLKQEGMDAWTVSYASTPQIIENKRSFNLLVASSYYKKMIAQYTHSGVPTAKDMLVYLYRTMAFANMVATKGVKPGLLCIDWRSRFMYDEMERELRKLGIACVKETYEQSLEVCKANGTDVNGWNHLD